MTTPAPDQAARFLSSFADQRWVRIVPRTGRRFTGQLVAVEATLDEPVMTLMVNGAEWRVPWSDVHRIKVHSADTREDQ